MEKEYPLVSVGIIAYNQENYLPKSIESCLAQDYPNFEIIIADDCSTDGSQDILKSYKEKHPDKITLILAEENKGITANSNACIKACEGKYITLMGGDDFWLPGKLEKQVSLMEMDSSCLLSGHSVYTCDQSTKITGKRKPPVVKNGYGAKAWIENGPLFNASSQMFRKSAIPEAGYDSRLPWVSDLKFAIDILGEKGKFSYLDEVFGVYRRHDQNITNSILVIMNDQLAFIDILEREYSNFGLSIRKSKAYLFYYGKGYTEQCSGNFSQAIKWYLKSIFTWPLSAKPYIRIAQIALNKINCKMKLVKNL